METKISYGIHTVTALLKRNAEEIKELYLLNNRRDKRIQAIWDLANHEQVNVHFKTREELDYLCQSEQHQGVAAKLLQSSTSLALDLDTVLNAITHDPLLLILDGVQDPHNLGACLRTADAAGVDAVIIPKDKAVGLTATVRKVASGAAETVPLISVTNLARTLQELKERGVWLYGAAEEAEASLYDLDLKGPIALVLGAEGSGLRRLTRENCDQLFNIPMHGSVSSLNVSVANGICLYEAVRQRRS